MTDILGALRDPETIRLRSAAITQAVADGRSSHFRIDRSRLPAVADRVAALTRERFPDLVIPYHSRWRHFEAGGVDRRAELDALLAGRDADDVARARIDLTVVSVLLDAGAGPTWHYLENERRYERSEGLAVASFRAFAGGAFAVDTLDPLRADADALRRIDAESLGRIFQATPANAIVGLDGRAGLLRRLGDALVAEAARDGTAARPGLLWDRLGRGRRPGGEVTAAQLLAEVLRVFGPVWKSGSVITGLPAGDVWPHRFAGADTARGRDPTTPGWVPFHKLSQWLTYSLLEPLQWAGVRVTGLDALTGLPEYRNGGLLLDAGAIVLRRARDSTQRWRPGDELVIEWRALTVTLLDEVAALVRERLGVDAGALPLACVLEGGTWAAGRQIAAELRSDGAPPLAIDSDGTVF